jgi:tetratricopeptide (TPR) repeat protein
MQKRKFAEARKNYEAQLAIAEDLAELDSSDADKQRELSIAHQRVAFALAMQNDLAGSEKSYRQAFEIAERLAKSNPSNAEWQFDLALAYGSVGAVVGAQGKLEDALNAYREQIAVLTPLLKLDATNAEWRKNMDDTGSNIGDLAHRLVLAHDFAKALEAANDAIAIMPDTVWLYAAKAPALMGTGRTDEARALYLKYRGMAKVLGDRSWNDLVLADFDALSRAGFTVPLMDEIEKSFGAETAGGATVAPLEQVPGTDAQAAQ